MTRWGPVAMLVGAALAAGSCGGRSSSPDAERVPLEHRASRASCSPERGGMTASSDGCPVDTETGRCAQDSDCGAGKNGRCENVGICPSSCTYDDCFEDADCTNQVPCACRLDLSDPTRCLNASNCATDADCGIGGYCSPSLVTRVCFGDTSAYVGGYFCHTKRDACVDDGDCPNSELCMFDTVEQRFSCRECNVRP